ncbi:transcriptional regulator [bacterium]|nr:MAG: transcriptional regulator [bacterium]
MAPSRGTAQSATRGRGWRAARRMLTTSNPTRARQAIAGRSERPRKTGTVGNGRSEVQSRGQRAISESRDAPSTPRNRVIRRSGPFQRSRNRTPRAWTTVQLSVPLLFGRDRPQTLSILTTFAGLDKYPLWVDDLSLVFGALSDPIRLAVLQCVRGCGGASAYDTETGACDAGTPGAVATCDVRCHVPCSPSSLSRHLAVLREAGLVETERRGRKQYVRVVPESLDRLARFFQTTPAACCGAPEPALAGASL